MLSTTTLFLVPICRHGIFKHHLRRLHSKPVVEYPLTHPIYTIWASNTSLGKTLVSAGLSISFLSSTHPKKFIYLKPVQTGFPDDSDSRFVYRKFYEFLAYKPLPFSVSASNHVLKVSVPAAKSLLRFVDGIGKGENIGIQNAKEGKFFDGFENVGLYEERKLQGSEIGADEFGNSELVCKTMHGWKEAVSPHLAAEREGAFVGDNELLDTLKRCIGSALGGKWYDKGELDAMCVIETAGGVASPGPSGSPQCDLYR